MEQLLLTTLITIATIVVMLFGYKILFSSNTLGLLTNKRNTVLLVGLSNAGKSTMISQLLYSQTKPTVPSMKNNTITYNTKTLIDIPGHIRLRDEYQRYLPQTQKIMFIVDSTSSSLLANIRELSEYLYQILSQSQVRRTPIPITIVCSKQDSLLAYKKDAVKNILEKEINILRSTKSRALSTLEDDSDEVFLGYEDSQFKFEDLENHVLFSECSATVFETIRNLFDNDK